jgi:hypothetical protein
VRRWSISLREPRPGVRERADEYRSAFPLWEASRVLECTAYGDGGRPTGSGLAVAAAGPVLSPGVRPSGWSRSHGRPEELPDSRDEESRLLSLNEVAASTTSHCPLRCRLATEILARLLFRVRSGALSQRTI